MRSRKYMTHDTTGEFELDLAPLLAVMVKLVPVLLVSSAFVQMMVIETDLPQVVKEAVQKNDEKPTAKITMEADGKSGLRIVVTENNKDTEAVIPMKDGGFDYPAIHRRLVDIKRGHPEVFKVDLRPAAGVAYGDIVKMMDEARRARDSAVTFPVKDQTTGEETQTPYMFPEVVFSNSLEG